MGGGGPSTYWAVSVDELRIFRHLFSGSILLRAVRAIFVDELPLIAVSGL
ncbi:MAG: hypothetical protein WC395_08165 [Bacteroidales bacterium]|jgi:hypothetical protein